MSAQAITRTMARTNGSERGNREFGSVVERMLAQTRQVRGDDT